MMDRQKPTDQKFPELSHDGPLGYMRHLFSDQYFDHIFYISYFWLIIVIVSWEITKERLFRHPVCNLGLLCAKKCKWKLESKRFVHQLHFFLMCWLQCPVVKVHVRKIEAAVECQGPTNNGSFFNFFNDCEIYQRVPNMTSISSRVDNNYF